MNSQEGNTEKPFSLSFAEDNRGGCVMTLTNDPKHHYVSDADRRKAQFLVSLLEAKVKKHISLTIPLSVNRNNGSYKAYDESIGINMSHNYDHSKKNNEGVEQSMKELGIKDYNYYNALALSNYLAFNFKECKIQSPNPGQHACYVNPEKDYFSFDHKKGLSIHSNKQCKFDDLTGALLIYEVPFTLNVEFPQSQDNSIGCYRSNDNILGINFNNHDTASTICDLLQDISDSNIQRPYKNQKAFYVPHHPIEAGAVKRSDLIFNSLYSWSRELKGPYGEMVKDVFDNFDHKNLCPESCEILKILIEFGLELKDHEIQCNLQKKKYIEPSVDECHREICKRMELSRNGDKNTLYVRGLLYEYCKQKKNPKIEKTEENSNSKIEKAEEKAEGNSNSKIETKEEKNYKNIYKVEHSTQSTTNTDPKQHQCSKSIG